jgi:hypothetical protein
MPERLPRVEILRRAVTAAVAAETLRGVAREIGLTAPAVQNFIDGAEPRRGSTLRKLENWYVGRRARTPDEGDLQAAEAALHIFVRDLPADRRLEVSLNWIAQLAQHYRAIGAPVPEWLEELRRRTTDSPAAH